MNHTTTHTDTTQIPQQVIHTKSRSLAILLTLFLGGVGAHKFYLGSPGLGLLYLLFCWTFIPAVIAFFELLGFLFMSNEKFERKYTRVTLSLPTPLE